MRRAERHHLKQNEIAAWVTYLTEQWAAYRRPIVIGVSVAVVVLLASGGYAWWRSHTNAQAQAMLGEALAVTEATVSPPPPPTSDGASPPPPPEGTYPSEQAKMEAALGKFQAVVAAYPSTDAGMIARYYQGGALASLGRTQEAEAQFREVESGGRGIYVDMAKLGLASLLAQEGKADQAIEMFEELSKAPQSSIPVDAVLMQLGRAYTKAGKRDQAIAAFTRIVDEFSSSAYGAEAKRELEALKPTSKT